VRESTRERPCHTRVVYAIAWKIKIASSPEKVIVQIISDRCNLRQQLDSNKIVRKGENNAF